MIVIGADTHKSSYALAAVDADVGVLVGELEVRADEDGHRRALRWARAWRSSESGRWRIVAAFRVAWSALW